MKNKLCDIIIIKNCAYHFDSHLLGEFLKKYSKRGVEVIDDIFRGKLR